MGVKVDRATANLSDLGEGTFELDAAVDGAGKDLLSFLKATPVGMQHGVQLLGVAIGGNGRREFSCAVADQARRTGGTHRQSHARRRRPVRREIQSPFECRQRRRAFQPARLHRRQSRRDDARQAGQTETRRRRVRLPIRNMRWKVRCRPIFPRAICSPTRRCSKPTAITSTGSAAWNVAFTADDDTVKSPSQRIAVKSDLRGVALDLPAPLAKDGRHGAAVHAASRSADRGRQGRSHPRRQICSCTGGSSPATQPFAANIRFGADTNAPLPPAGL